MAELGGGVLSCSARVVIAQQESLFETCVVPGCNAPVDLRSVCPDCWEAWGEYLTAAGDAASFSAEMHECGCWRFLFRRDKAAPHATAHSVRKSIRTTDRYGCAL